MAANTGNNPFGPFRNLNLPRSFRFCDVAQSLKIVPQITRIPVTASSFIHRYSPIFTGIHWPASRPRDTSSMITLSFNTIFAKSPRGAPVLERKTEIVIWSPGLRVAFVQPS